MLGLLQFHDVSDQVWLGNVFIDLCNLLKKIVVSMETKPVGLFSVLDEKVKRMLIPNMVRRVCSRIYLRFYSVAVPHCRTVQCPRYRESFQSQKCADFFHSNSNFFSVAENLAFGVKKICTFSDGIRNPIGFNLWCSSC